MHEFSREELLFGSTAMERLKEAAVAVFGLGCVGSYTAEALARGGVGRLALVDGDGVALTNINRQLLATHRTVGRRKVDVMGPYCRDQPSGTRRAAGLLFIGGHRRAF